MSLNSGPSREQGARSTPPSTSSRGAVGGAGGAGGRVTCSRVGGRTGGGAVWADDGAALETRIEVSRSRTPALRRKRLQPQMGPQTTLTGGCPLPVRVAESDSERTEEFRAI